MYKKIGMISSLCLLGVVLIACHGNTKKQKSPPQKTPVTVIKVKKERISIPHASVGSIVSLQNPEIKAQVTGQITQIYVRAGDPVFQGQLLAQMMDTRQQNKLQQEEANLEAAQAKLKEKTYTAEQYKYLVGQGAASELQYKQAVTAMEVAKASVSSAQHAVEMAQDNVNRAMIKAPIMGHVQAVYASVGEFVQPGEKLFKLVNRTMLQARLPFSEKDADRFHVGQNVTIISRASPNIRYQGTVTEIEPAINPNNRSFFVLVHFADNAGWHVGASTHAQVYLDVKQSVFIVPKASVVLTSKGDVLYTLKDGKAYEHKVNIVYAWDQEAAIESDIPNGAEIVVDGANYLSNGSLVEIKGKHNETAATQSSGDKNPGKNNNNKTDGDSTAQTSTMNQHAKQMMRSAALTPKFPRVYS